MVRHAGKEDVSPFLFVSNLTTGLTAEWPHGWGAREAARHIHVPLCFRKRLSWPWLLSATSTTPWRPGRRTPPGRVSGPRGFQQDAGVRSLGLRALPPAAGGQGVGGRGPRWAPGRGGWGTRAAALGCQVRAAGGVRPLPLQTGRNTRDAHHAEPELLSVALA